MTAVTHTFTRSLSSEHGPLSSNEKIDICRGLFAFLVVAAHAVDISWVVHPEVPGRFPAWFHSFLLYVFAAGVYWVIGFFVISGYCIQLSVERQIDGQAFPLRHYLLARLSRILPLYYLALLLAVVVERLMVTARPTCWPRGVSLSGLIAQLFIVQNLTCTYGCFAPSWSITNEMFYYLFYGAIVCVALRLGIRPTSLGIGLCLLLALVLDWVYFFEYRTGYAAVPGCFSGWGSSGSREHWSPSIASGFAIPGGRHGLGALALGAHAGDGNVAFPGHSLAGRLPRSGCGVYLDADAIRRDRVARRPGCRTGPGHSHHSPGGVGKLSDLSLSRPDRDAHGVADTQVEPGERLAANLAHPDEYGNRLGTTPGPPCRAAHHGMASRVFEATAAYPNGTRARRHDPDF